MARARKYAAGGTAKPDADWTQSSQMGAGQSSDASNPNALGVTAPKALNTTPQSPTVKSSGTNASQFGGATPKAVSNASQGAAGVPTFNPYTLYRNPAAPNAGDYTPGKPLPPGTGPGGNPDYANMKTGAASTPENWQNFYASNVNNPALQQPTPGTAPRTGTTGGGLPWYTIGATDTQQNRAYTSADDTIGIGPGLPDVSTPNWNGPAMQEVFMNGVGYNVPMNTDMSKIGTGPGQTPPNKLPPGGLPMQQDLSHGTAGDSFHTQAGNPGYAAMVARDSAKSLASPNALLPPIQYAPGDGPSGPMSDPYWQGAYKDQIAQRVAQADAQQTPAQRALNAKWVAGTGPAPGPGYASAQAFQPGAGVAPVAHAKGGAVGFNKGGAVGDSKPRHVGIIHKHGSY